MPNGNGPTGPPAGETAGSGSWQFINHAWTWVKNTGATTPAPTPDSNHVGATSVGTPGPTDFSNSQANGRQNVGPISSFSGPPKVDLNKTVDYNNAHPYSNPFGDQYQSNLSYTPFGLSPYQQQQGQYGLPSAFGGLSFNSDLLVPHMEQQRMQRILGAYQPSGTGNGGNNGGQ